PFSSVPHGNPPRGWRPAPRSEKARKPRPDSPGSSDDKTYRLLPSGVKPGARMSASCGEGLKSEGCFHAELAAMQPPVELSRCTCRESDSSSVARDMLIPNLRALQSDTFPPPGPLQRAFSLSIFRH